MNEKCNYPRKLAYWELGKRNIVEKGNYTIKEAIGVTPEPEQPDTIRIIDSSLTIKQKEKIKNIFFTVNGAYPMLIDGLCYICTNYKFLSHKYGRKIIQLDDVSNAVYFMVDMPVEDFFDYALDGDKDAKKQFMREVESLEIPKNVVKYVPISKTEVVKIAPIHVGFIRQEEENIGKTAIQRLSNISSRDEYGNIILKTTRYRIQIYFLKSLFAPIIAPKDSEGYFPIPQAFQSKIEKTLKNNKFPINIPPINIRQHFIFLNMHDNSTAKEITIDEIDYWRHISPKVLAWRGDKAYLRNKAGADLTLEVMNFVLCLMAKDSLIAGAKMVPTTVEKVSEKGKYIIGIERDTKKIDTDATNSLLSSLLTDCYKYQQKKKEEEAKKRQLEQSTQKPKQESQLAFPFDER